MCTESPLDSGTKEIVMQLKACDYGPKMLQLCRDLLKKAEANPPTSPRRLPKPLNNGSNAKCKAEAGDRDRSSQGPAAAYGSATSG